MALDETQINRLTQILEAAADSAARLSDWENNFIDDTRERYEEYGGNTKVSGKQWDVLESIFSKC